MEYSNRLLLNKKYKYALRKKRQNKSKKFLSIVSIILVFVFSLFFFFFRKHKKRAIFKYIYNNNNIDYINNINSINATLVSYINQKIYWNNETSININKAFDEINNIHKINISFDYKDDFIQRDLPKISVIITLHNQEKNIKTIYRCLYAQELKDIEIIFVDDASTDNSSLIIKDLMNKDERIIYLKNDVNQRALLSRKKGILNSKGEYILVIDPDDMIINNILIKAYTTAKKYDLDIVQFYAIIGTYARHNLWSLLKYKDGILRNNTKVRNHFYNTVSRNLWDKLIRRETYIKSIDFMKEDFSKEIYFINNDDTAMFGLIHVAESYGFLEQIGYFYILRAKGEYDYRSSPNNTNLVFRSIFNNMRYFYLQSDNNTNEKNNLAYKYFAKHIKTFKDKMQYFTEGFEPIFDVLDLYLNSTYFDGRQKGELDMIKSKFINRKKYLKRNLI